MVFQGVEGCGGDVMVRYSSAPRAGQVRAWLLTATRFSKYRGKIDQRC